MSFSEYPTYKDSGAAWAKAIPDSWEATKLRRLATIYSGGTPDKSNLSYWEGGTIPWLNSGAVNDVMVTEPSAYITEEAFAKSSAKWVPEQSLVMALAGQGKTKGMVAQVAFRTTCNQSMAAITPHDTLQPRFLFWWLNSNYQNIRNLAGGDLRDGLNLNLLGDIFCPIPSSDEQKVIVAFLDHETAKIDALVEEQRRLIELLKEKRQAVISHAVTKGLNPNAPMKDSGIEWLGEVPEHWTVQKLGYAAKLQSGYAFSSSDFSEVGTPIVRMNNLDRGKLELSQAVHVREDKCPASTALEAGDLLWGMSGSLGDTGSLGNFARVSPDHLPAQLNQRVGRFIVCPDRLSNDYLEIVIQSEPFYEQIVQYVTGTAQSNISSTQVQSCFVAIPPLDEQLKITDHLSIRIRLFKTLTDDIGQSIALLLERRTALISAAVTGKIDVRNFTAKETEAA